ncbi:hypothetical protein BDAP_002595 [Binucleata daphniae]
MLKDINKVVPSVLEHKHDQKNKLVGLLELMDMNDCTSIFYIETTKRVHYLWIGHINGPSIRFKTYNQFTMQELSFPVNCSKNAGHKLIFDKNFDNQLKLVKDVFSAVFVESEVFDRVITFFYVDNKIWMRIYAIKEDGLKEIGPRMVLEVDKVLEGCLQGKKVFQKENEVQEHINEDIQVNDTDKQVSNECKLKTN